MTTVLIAYSSRWGGTAEIAHTIAEKLRERSLSVDCLPVGAVNSLHGYDAVVLGSAVYFNRWRSDALRFLQQHAADLAQMPFWAFSSGPVGSNPPPSETFEPRRELALAERLNVRGHVVFGGRVVRPDRRGIRRSLVGRIPSGDRDRRDWGAIRTWATAIAAELARDGAPLAPGR